jgi:O-antigen ligase
LSTALLGLFFYLLARYGILEILEKKQFGKMFLLLAVFVLTLGGGFRSFLILMALVVFVLAYLEGLFRSKYAPLAVCAALGIAGLLISFADKLPLPIQRSIAILPIKLDPRARIEAERSTEWRLEMWRMVLPEIPRYFWLGKGLEVAVTELDLSTDLSHRGLADLQESSIVAGNYHNGPLTVLIPFGIWGAIGWLWFVAASLRALHYNYCYGDERLRKVNALLLALFIGRTLLFFIVFGDFRVEFPLFLGSIGLSLALNGGIRKPVRVRAPLVPIRTRAQPVKLVPDLSH